MVLETGERIYSNDYADFSIRHSGDLSIFQGLEDATYQRMNDYVGVIRVPVQQITNKSILTMGYAVMPSLSGIISRDSLEESGITKVRNIPNFNLRGQGVLIGLLDTGIDYTNPLFIRADNTTKILTLWDQGEIGDDYQSNTYYGTEYSQEEINRALLSDHPYEIVPSNDEIGHGTMLAAIAAGNEDFEHNFSGVVPDAELVVVKLKDAKPYLKEFWRIPADTICYQENDILFALEYLELTANKFGRPMSICVAIGSAMGPHDNTSFGNTALSLRAENNNFAIVVAAGNEGNARRHFRGIINPVIGYETVELNVGENESGFSMELWGDSPGLFSLDIKTPSGEFIPKVLPRINETYEITFIFEQTIILIDYQIVEKQSGDQLILLRFTKPSPGIWTFHVFGKGDLSLSFHIWLPMNGFISDNTFFVRSDPYTTILSMGNATDPITATAYNTEDDSLYLQASRGFTRLNNVKPDIAAPGVNVLAPNLDQGFHEVSGSSPAAAHTAGVAAMILEWGIVKGDFPIMDTSDIKTLMIRGAKRNADMQYPNRDWGYGILDVFQIFDSLRPGM